MNWPLSVLRWIERKNFVSVHSLMLYVTMVQTWGVTVQAWKYAFESRLTSGAEIAMVIAAVTVPFAALQKFVFDTYSASRKPPTQD